MCFEAGGYTPDPDFRWKAGKDKIDELFATNHIQFNSDGIPMEKKYLHEEPAPNEPIYSLLSEKISGTAESGKRVLTSLVGNQHGFDTVKPIELLTYLTGLIADDDAVILDFFSGSATTAHAVMKLNTEDDGNRKFIMVQLPEVCDEKSEAAKAGYKSICEIGEERIRRAGKKIADELEPGQKLPDIGFRVFKIDSSNFEDVARDPDSLVQDALFGLADNLKADRTPEDILYQLFPRYQIPYTASVEALSICGKTVYSVDNGNLVACFDQEVPQDVIRAMAQMQPNYAVMRDASFVGDDALANFAVIFKTLSKETEIKVV